MLFLILSTSLKSLCKKLKNSMRQKSFDGCISVLRTVTRYNWTCISMYASELFQARSAKMCLKLIIVLNSCNHVNNRRMNFCFKNFIKVNLSTTLYIIVRSIINCNNISLSLFISDYHIHVTFFYEKTM